VSTPAPGGHVDTMESLPSTGRRRRRLPRDEFMADTMAAASQPGMSMASVALARGSDANLLRRWVRDAEMPPAKVNAKLSETVSCPALAGAQDVSFLTLLLTHHDGQQRVLDKGRFRVACQAVEVAILTHFRISDDDGRGSC